MCVLTTWLMCEVAATDDEGLFVDDNPGDNIDIDAYAIGRLQRVIMSCS